jgi:surface protein
MIDSSNSHTYASPGDYTVIVDSSNVTQFGNGQNLWVYGGEYLTSVTTWNDNLISLSGAFYGCTSLVNVPVDLPTSVTDLSYMFAAATTFNQSLSTWDVSSVTNTNAMFYNSKVFNQTLDSWDVSSVTNTSAMFAGAINFNQPLNNWDTASVVDMRYMFYNSKVFNQTLGYWDVSSVTNTFAMFAGAIKFNQPLNNWDTASVVDMSYMFAAATTFNQSLSTWDVSSVTNTIAMFQGCRLFNQPLNTWNTVSVVNTSNMFAGAINFNQPLNNWDTASVVDMSNMFAAATTFNQSLSTWDVTSVVTGSKGGMAGMLNGTAISTTNYDSILNGWASQNVNKYITLGAQGCTYTLLGGTSRYKLINNKHWTINDGGVICYASGTKILCDTGYIAIENLKPGMLVQTYLEGLREIEYIGSGKMTNNPNKWNCCMYRLPKKDEMIDDLIVTGAHGILKESLTDEEKSLDTSWFDNQEYSKIGKMYLIRAAFCKDFVKIENSDEYTYYHLALKSVFPKKRYAIWANGVLSESTFKRNVLKLKLSGEY